MKNCYLRLCAVPRLQASALSMRSEHRRHGPVLHFPQVDTLKVFAACGNWPRLGR
jgi:hypothetical protein